MTEQNKLEQIARNIWRGKILEHLYEWFNQETDRIARRKFMESFESILELYDGDKTKYQSMYKEMNKK